MNKELITMNTTIKKIRTIPLFSGLNEKEFNDITKMIAPGQNSTDVSTTLVMMDEAGPFDYHLNKKLTGICKDKHIPYEKDIFRYYRSDSASTIEAGSDIRTALVGFGIDASHGYERTHISTLKNTGKLIFNYLQSDPTFKRDRNDMSTINGFLNQPIRVRLAEIDTLYSGDIF